jgi:hypothetical protein
MGGWGGYQVREAYAGLVRAVDGSTEKAQRVALVANQVRCRPGLSASGGALLGGGDSRVQTADCGRLACADCQVCATSSLRDSHVQTVTDQVRQTG